MPFVGFEPTTLRLLKEFTILGSYVTDSCIEEEEEDEDVDEVDDIEPEQLLPYDHDSLAFERDLEKDEHLYVDKNTLYKLELFDELQVSVAKIAK